LGSQTVSYGQPVFDENAYNKALSSYQQDPTGASRTAATNDIASLNAQIAANKNPQGQYDPAFDAALSEAQGRLGALGQGSAMPTREQFTTTNVDQPTVTQTLTPAAQSTLESQQRVQRSLAGLAEQGIGTASQVLGQVFKPNLPGIQTDLGNAGQITQTPELSYYGMAGAGPSAGQYGFAQGGLNTSNVAAMPVNAGMTGQQAIMARLAPQLERADAATRQRLVNQGLVPGGEAYENAMISQNQQKNDLLSQAALQGIGLDTAANAQGFGQALQAGQFGNQAVAQNFGLGQAANAAQNAAVGQNQQAALAQQQAALAAQNQQYNQLLQGAQFGNTAQQQSLAQQLQLENQPLNKIIGLLGSSQIQMPQFQGYQGSNIAPAPVFAGAQAAGQNAMQNYGIQQSGVNAQNAGLYSLLGSGAMAAGMFSDRRLKSNIERVGTHRLGIGIYEYDIFGERQRGVMADEVEKVMPEAVINHASGFKMVNYGAIQ
jgi:hypothetical protein